MVGGHVLPVGHTLPVGHPVTALVFFVMTSLITTIITTTTTINPKNPTILSIIFSEDFAFFPL